MAEIFVLLCEEIRREENGMRSIIGVFPPGGLRRKLPAILPKFGVFFFSEGPAELEFEYAFQINITSPQKEQIYHFESEHQVHKVKKAGRVASSVNISPLLLAAPGPYVIRVERIDGLTGEAVLFVDDIKD
jgi:hypothetical protein